MRRMVCPNPFSNVTVSGSSGLGCCCCETKPAATDFYFAVLGLRLRCWRLSGSWNPLVWGSWSVLDVGMLLQGSEKKKRVDGWYKHKSFLDSFNKLQYWWWPLDRDIYSFMDQQWLHFLVQITWISSGFMCAIYEI